MTTSTPDGPTAGARLRAAMDERGCVALPGAYDGLLARAVAKAGFAGCYVSGAAVSTTMGVPDIGLATLDRFTHVIHIVASSSGLPVLADADTGFGEGEVVVRVVFEYARAGAAGFHIEDQVFPKRCGHLGGKALVPIEHMVEKVERARMGSEGATGGSFIVCARTDARGVEGLDAAIERARAYAKAGADMLFPEGLHSVEEFERFAGAMRGVGGPGRNDAPYLLANMTEFGRTPITPTKRFGEIGYSCVIYPYPTLRLAMGHAQRLLAALRDDGHVGDFVDQMQTRDEMYDLLEYTPGEEWTYPSPASADDSASR
jgi:methylisocitrate lyase